MADQQMTTPTSTVVPDPLGRFFQVCAEGRVVKGDFTSQQEAEDWRQVHIESARVWR